MEAPLVPLAERIRPKDFENFIGQSHLIGPNGPIKKAVNYKQVFDILSGKYPEDIMLDKSLYATRQLAKRQITWIRSWENYLKIGINEIKPLEDSVKKSLLKARASPEIISKNLAELKANKISQKRTGKLVLGADSVIDLNGDIISKPSTRIIALEILKKLNGKKHNLISSVKAFLSWISLSRQISAL